MIINLLSLFKLVFLMSGALGAETIKLGTFKVPKYVQNKSQGTFIELVNTIAKRAHFKIEIELYPPKRTVHSFLQGNLDGYFPALDVLNSKPVNRSAPFYYKKDYLFSLNEKKKAENRLCLTIGYPYDLQALGKKYDLIYSSSDETCFKMLKKGRADFFLCELHTGLRVVRNLGIKDFIVNPKFVSSMPVFFAFSNSEAGEKYSQAFSREIKKMRESGELSKMFQELREESQKTVGFDFDPTKKD